MRIPRASDRGRPPPFLCLKLKKDTPVTCSHSENEFVIKIAARPELPQTPTLANAASFGRRAVSWKSINCFSVVL